MQMFLGENVSGENVSGENVSGENVSLYRRSGADVLCCNISIFCIISLSSQISDNTLQLVLSSSRPPLVSCN